MCGSMCLCGGGGGTKGVEVALETYHDKEGIDQGESNDDKCHSLKQH